MERQQYADRRVGRVSRIGLLEREALVRESPHPAIAPKIVIEGPIFLDQDDHMFDVGQFAAARGRTGRNNGVAAASSAAMEERAPQPGGGHSTAEFQQIATRNIPERQ